MVDDGSIDGNEATVEEAARVEPRSPCAPPQRQLKRRAQYRHRDRRARGRRFPRRQRRMASELSRGEQRPAAALPAIRPASDESSDDNTGEDGLKTSRSTSNQSSVY